MAFGSAAVFVLSIFGDSVMATCGWLAVAEAISDGLIASVIVEVPPGALASFEFAFDAFWASSVLNDPLALWVCSKLNSKRGLASTFC